MVLPELIVFDLDFTLWDCGGLWVDCTRYPFRKQPDGSVVDGDARKLALYEDVPAILDRVDDLGIRMALASRTERPEWAVDLLEKLEIENRFPIQEIYPSSKVRHFAEIASRSGCAYEQMLFFDDEHRNIAEVGELGVHCVEVRGGLDAGFFESGLERFARSGRAW